MGGFFCFSENNIAQPIKIAHNWVWLVPLRMLAAAISDHILVRMQSPWLDNEKEILLTASLIISEIHLGRLKLWKDAMIHQFTVIQQHSNHKTQSTQWVSSCIYFCVCVMRGVIILKSLKQCALRQWSTPVRPPAGVFYLHKKIKMNWKLFLSHFLFRSLRKGCGLRNQEWL